MPTHLHKNRKKRGHVSAGHGRIGKHRKHPGGRGKAGGITHHRINFDKFHPGYFGKVGMRHFHLLKQKHWAPSVNIDKLWSFVPEDIKNKIKNNPDGQIPVVNVLDHGYAKVLGKGGMPKLPIIVKTRLVSSLAEKKIKMAGGKVELIA